MSLNPEVIESLYLCAESYYGQLRSDDDVKVRMFYVGDLSAGLSSALSSRLEKLLESEIGNRQAHKRFFYVFIEALQNVRIHGIADSLQKVYGAVIVFEKNSKLCATLMNLTRKKTSELLINKYSETNALSKEDLKAKYLDILQTGEISDKGGGGLGIITMVMRSRNPVEFERSEAGDGYDVFQTTLSIALY